MEFLWFYDWDWFVGSLLGMFLVIMYVRNEGSSFG